MAYDKETMIGSLETSATRDQAALVKGSVSIPRTTSENDEDDDFAVEQSEEQFFDSKIRHSISKTNCKTWLCLYRFEM